MDLNKHQNITGIANMRFAPKKYIQLLGLSLVLITIYSGAQVTGGTSSFEYLRLSNSAHVTALGGISIANPDQDIALALQNPAMMRPGLHNELELTYNSYYAGISIMNLQYGYHAPKVNTSFFFGVQYLNYGNFSQTDNVGNVYGDIHASDYSITMGASRKYQEHWRYGADIKMANSHLGTYSANAAMVDVGINYYDTANLIDIGATAKNMGVMISKYNPGQPAEPIPFDLQLGISKRFKHVPLRVFATIHHLYEWDVRYNNPADLTGTNALGVSDTAKDNSSHFGDKLFRHFIFGAEFTLGKHLLLTAAYNDLRRRELILTSAPGLAGFSFGVAADIKMFKIHYGRAFYNLTAYNEISITMALNKMFGLGKTGEKIKWNAEYANWE